MGRDYDLGKGQGQLVARLILFMDKIGVTLNAIWRPRDYNLRQPNCNIGRYDMVVGPQLGPDHLHITFIPCDIY